jgi:Glycosyltransferase
MIYYDLKEVLRNRNNNEIYVFNPLKKGDKVEGKFLKTTDEYVIRSECYNKFDRYSFFEKQKKLKSAVEKSFDISTFDMIHAHTLFNGGYAAYKLHKKYKTPYVLSIRNTDSEIFMKIPGFLYIAKKILNCAAGIIFISESCKNKVLNKKTLLPIKEALDNKQTVIYNGLENFWHDNALTEPKQLKSDVISLLCVGRIDKNKNMLTVLKVLDKLNTDNIKVRLHIAGEVVDENIKEKLQVHENVIIHPFMSKDELLLLYRKTDIFIMPSIYETFGRAYAEAMTQGLPVIYTKGQGFDGIFSEGSVGYSVTPLNPEVIADAVKKVINNYSAISKRCIENYEGFNWDIIAEKMERFYDTAFNKIIH